LLNREADIAVRMVAPRQAALIAKKVAPVELGFFASPDFLKAYPCPKTYNEFAQSARFIGDDRKGIIAKWFITAKLKPPRYIVFRTDDDVAQLAAVRAGLGIGIAQLELAKRSGLVRVLPEIAPRLESWIVMHEDMKSMRRVRLVFDYLVDVLS
jgi:DNA-binding transcriptional LysR family regulator